MTRPRKKKVPLTTSARSTSWCRSSNKPQSSRTLIRKFHLLLKRQGQLRSSQNLGSLRTETTKPDELAKVERDIEELGGLEAYQRMSTVGQGKDRGGGSETVLMKWLKELGLNAPSHPSRGEGKLRLLEVGALKPDNYQQCGAWIENTPMDLRSQHPEIKEQDFLLLSEAENEGKWNVISLSLVLNFVPEARDRGKMLCIANKLLSRDGLLFLALPLPCVQNSRYLTFDHLNALMSSINFVQVKRKWKDGGKMAYWLYKKSNPTKSELDLTLQGAIDGRKLWGKAVKRMGNRNNFCILLWDDMIPN